MLRMRKLLRGALIISLLAAGLGLVFTVSFGQESAWLEPTMLSVPSESGWFPHIAADPSGAVHVVWSSGRAVSAETVYDTVLYRWSRDGQAWSELNDIVAMLQVAGGEVTRPFMVSDETGVLHMSYRQTDAYYSSAYAPLADSVAAWREPIQLTQQRVAYFSELATGADGTLHLIYTNNVTTPNCRICYHVFYRRSEDEGATWTEAVDVSRILTGSAKPRLVLHQATDSLHVIWESGEGGSYGQLADAPTILYASSFDGGDNWTFPTQLSPPGIEGRNPTMALDGLGRLVAVWLGLPEDRIFYQLSADLGRTWSEPLQIPRVAGGWGVYQARLDDYDLAMDSAGALHLVAVGRLTEFQEELDLLHLVWRDELWSEPQVITSYSGDVPEWPRLAISHGNRLHAVWFVRDEAHIFDSDNQRYQIWYASTQVDAPAIRPARLATATPSPTPEPAAPQLSVTEPAATVAPRPEIASGPPPDHQLIDSEMAALRLIAMSLLPAVLFVGAAIVGIRIRRR